MDGGERTDSQRRRCSLKSSHALEQLQRGVLFGVPYPFPLFEVRRFLLPKSRYHVFYSVEGDLLKVRAVWHASRGKGPPLG